MGIIHPRVWVEHPNRAKGIHQQEADKQATIILKRLKWEEGVLPKGPMFEIVPVGS